VPGSSSFSTRSRAQQLAARGVLLDRVGATALTHGLEMAPQLGGEGTMMLGVGLELGARGVEVRLDAFHACVRLLDGSVDRQRTR
jgi:hypothetical protein